MASLFSYRKSNAVTCALQLLLTHWARFCKIHCGVDYEFYFSFIFALFSKRASAMLMKDASLRTCSAFGFPKRKESKTTLIELTIPSDTFFSCYIIHDVDDVVSTLSLKC